MIVSNQLNGRSLRADGKEYLFFSGTAYLGIPQHQAFQRQLLEGIKRFGTNWGSSRASNLQLEVFEQAEQRLATMAGAAAALTLSSGYLMCQMVVNALRKEGSMILAPGTHPSLMLEGCRLCDQDYAQWVERLPELIDATLDEKIVIIANSVNVLQARQYDFSWVKQLPKHKKFTLLLDDSHGFGITGKDGGGVYASLQLPAHVRLIVVSSLAKAMGLPGGVVFADQQTIAQFQQSACFRGSSPIVPAYLYAFLRSAQVYQEQRTKLQTLIQYFTQALGMQHAFQSFENYPVFYTPHNQLAEQLKQKGILISSFPYPLPTDSAITRVILNSHHTQQDIDQLLQALQDVQLKAQRREPLPQQPRDRSFS